MDYINQNTMQQMSALLKIPNNTTVDGRENWIEIFENSGLVHHDDGRLTMEPNITNEFKGFYISHNPYESAYGGETTALILGQGQRFYILKGDHRKEYQGFLSSFTECMNYYCNNPNKLERFSDNIPVILNEKQ
ncbi:hypothetical protein [Paenibacillus sp. Mc5Re-14]|uniref:hypothetical protein n=1 Tax=Paenibacillus sp. Mc5Re-14 TaxID=1030529 RepID=UPI000AECFC62|nr:hypothetical protein [Paenibacillus sp. Mc5Re-14]